MRNNEEFVKDRILAYYDSIEIIEGEDPPDYYVISNKEKTLLEVTNIEDIYFDGQRVHNRLNIERSIDRLCKRLKAKYAGKLSNNDSLMLFFEGPFTSTNRLENQLSQTIEKITSNDELVDEKFPIESGYVTIKRTSVVKDNIYGIIGVKTNRYSADIAYNARVALKERILTKENKMNQVSSEKYNGGKWLALLNNSVLASNNTYMRLMKELNISHTFDRILMVDKEGRLTELY